MIIRLLFIIATVLLGVSLQAAVQKMPVKLNDQIQIVLAKAAVQVTAAKEPFLTLSVGAGCRDIRQESQQEGILRLKEVDLQKARGDNEACQIQIQLPNNPSQIHVLDGSVSLQKTNADLFVQVQKGRITAKDGSGVLVLHSEKGDISVSDWAGKLRLDLGSVNSVVRNLQGDLEFRGLSGDHLIEKIKGNIRALQSAGSLKVVGGVGALSAESVRGAVSILNFGGRIDGIGQEATWNLNLSSEPDVNIRTQGGRVHLATGSAQGALVQLSTQEGELVPLPFMSVSKDGSSKSVKARLRGEVGKGLIVVRAQEGSIFLK